jgi:hypothetical protein
MILLDKQSFISRKKSSTVVIYGCGSSINKIKQDQLKDYDSIGFNWFCKSQIATTFYLIREQASSKKRIGNGESVVQLFNELSHENYKRTCLLVHRMKKTDMNYCDQLAKFSQDGIVVADIKKKDVNNFREYDVYDNGIIHGKSSVINTLHLAHWLGYEQILFVGVDLNNSKYFWLDDEVRYSIKKKGLTNDSRHPVSAYIMAQVKMFINLYKEPKLFTYRSDSLLAKVLPVWNP